MALFFDSLKSDEAQVSGITQLDNAMQGVENKINLVRDQISGLGSSSQLDPLIDSFRELDTYLNNLKNSNIGEMDRNFSSMIASASQLVSTLNNVDDQSLQGVKASMQDISSSLQNINNASSLNQLISTLDKLETTFEDISLKSSKFSETLANTNLDSFNMDQVMQQNAQTLDNFVSNCPGKFNQVREEFNKIFEIKDLSPDEITSVISSVKDKINELTKDMNDNLKIGEKLSEEFSNGGESASEMLNVIQDVIQKMNTSLDQVSFNRINEEVDVTIDRFSQLNNTSFGDVTRDLNSLTDIIKVLQKDFSDVKKNIDGNGESLDKLSDIISRLNNGNNDISFNSNIEQILSDANRANELIKESNHVDPSFAIQSYEKIKSANDELIKMKEQMLGINKDNPTGALSSQLFADSRDGGLFSDEFLNNDSLINSTNKLKETLSSYGDAYADIVSKLDGQLKDLESKRDIMINRNMDSKVESFSGLMTSIGDKNDDYSHLLDFNLLNRNTSGSSDDLRFMSNNVNMLGTSSIKAQQKISSHLKTEENDKINSKKGDKLTNKAFGDGLSKSTIDDIKSLERMVLEFNKAKKSILPQIGNAISSGNSDEIEKAKTELQNLIDFSIAASEKADSLGKGVKVKSKQQYNNLPSDTKSIVNEINSMMKITNEIGYDVQDLAKGFGMNVDKVKELNQELESTREHIEQNTQVSNSFGASMSSRFSSMTKGIGKVAGWGTAIGIGGLSLRSIIGNTGQYYKDRGMMDVESFQGDMMLGGNYNLAGAQDRNHNKALGYHQVSHGLIGFNDYNDSYNGLIKNVGAQNGISDRQAVSDLSTINDGTFALSKVYGISDSTIQNATKTFYQDLGMSAKDTTNTINELVQVAKSANVPIDKYVSQMSSLAQNYKNVGLSGEDAKNVMSNLLMGGMNIDMASGFAQNVGSAVNTFGNNTSANAYFGVLSGQYSNPFQAIKAGRDKYDEDGNLRSDYGSSMATTMDTMLSTYSRIGGHNSDQNWNVIYDAFKNQYGFDDKNASIATNKYINDREGFSGWIQDKTEKEFGGEGKSIEVETQEELIAKLAGMSSQLSETQKIEAQLKEGAFALSTSLESFGDNYLSVLRVQLDQLIQNIVGLSSSFAGFVQNSAEFIGDHGNELMVGGSLLAGGYVANKASKFVGNISNAIGRRSSNAGRAAGEVIEHSDDIARTASGIPWSKLGKAGAIGLLAGGAAYGAYNLFNGMFGGGSEESAGMPMLNNQLGTNQLGINNQLGANNQFSSEYTNYLNQTYGGSQVGFNSYGTPGVNQSDVKGGLDKASYYGLLNNTYLGDYTQGSNQTDIMNYLLSGSESYKPKDTSNIKSMQNYGSVGGGKVNNMLELGVGASYVGGDYLANKAYSSNFLGVGSKLGKFGGYGVGEVFGEVGKIGQHVIQGDYVDGDVQNHLSKAAVNGGGSVAGAAIGSLAGPIGTFVGGIVGGFATDLLNLIKVGDKGLGTTATDAISVAFGGSTTEELEYKRAVINNPKELLDNRNAMLGMTREQSDNINETMKEHAGELSHLTEEQKTAMKVLTAQLETFGLDTKTAFSQLTTLFSPENINNTMNNLSDSIKNAIESAELPDGWTEEDLKQVEDAKNENFNNAMTDQLNSSSYIKDTLLKNGISEYDANRLSVLGNDELRSIYGNSNHKDNETIKNLIDDWGVNDAEKAAAKETSKLVDEKSENKKRLEDLDRFEKNLKEINKTQVVNSQIYGEDDSLFNTYLEKKIKETQKVANNRKSSLTEEELSRDLEYESANNLIETLNSLLLNSKEESTLTSEAKRNFKNGDNKLNTGFLGSEKTYNNEKDYIRDYIKENKSENPYYSLASEDYWKQEASKDVLGAVNTGDASIYGENKQIKKLIDDNKENAEVNDKTLKEANELAKMSGISLNEAVSRLTDINSNISKMATNSGGMPLPGTANNTGIPGLQDLISAPIYNGGDTSLNARNYTGPEGFMKREEDIEIINNSLAQGSLAGKGGMIADAAASYGVDPMLLTSIIKLESDHGRSPLAVDHNNFGGIKNNSKGSDYDAGNFAGYDSQENGIKDMARTLKEVYYNAGLKTIEDIGNTYAPSSDGNVNWAGKVSSIYNGLTGKPVSSNLAQAANSEYAIPETGATSIGAAVVQVARAQIGTPYILGTEGSEDWDGDGESINGFDCSGLVSYALEKAGAGVGRLTADGLYRKCQKISKSELRAGDLGFTVKGGKADHVGVYSGEGTWIHAPSPGQNVSEHSNAGFNEYGRLPGTQGTTDLDLSQFATGSGSSSGSSSYESAMQQINSSGIFASGSMLYGIVPSDYASNFSNDPNQRSNYAEMATNLMAQGGAPATSLYSQNESRMARMIWEDTSMNKSNSVYTDTINSIGNSTGGKKYDINVKLDTSSSGDSKIEKEIKEILDDTVRRLEDLGLSVGSLEDTVELIDQTLYSERG